MDSTENLSKVLRGAVCTGLSLSDSSSLDDARDWLDGGVFGTGDRLLRSLATDPRSLLGVLLDPSSIPAGRKDLNADFRLTRSSGDLQRCGFPGLSNQRWMEGWRPRGREESWLETAAATELLPHDLGSSGNPACRTAGRKGKGLSLIHI